MFVYNISFIIDVVEVLFIHADMLV